MPPALSFAEQIRVQLEHVQALRQKARTLGLADEVQAVKSLQGRRFRGTYRDMLLDPGRVDAARFFLEELYSARDFSERDQQFGRIAGAIERLFPQDIGRLSCDLAELHALTESLDLTMAGHWQALSGAASEPARYLSAWRATGQAQARHRQLAVVEHLGSELERLTRSKSLRMALRMMRKPAEVAGLGALQHFLEQGFDAFARLDNARLFLESIATRERQWIEWLYDAPQPQACEQLRLTLALGDRAD